MAKVRTKMNKKARVVTKQNLAGFAAKMNKQSASKFTRMAMKLYGEEVLMNRAVPDFRDGLKPVQRRIIYYMWAKNMVHLTKASRVIGGVIGELHPHGEASVFDALVNLTQYNAHMNPVYGHGNWGSYSENAGAPRYIECKLEPSVYPFFTEYMAIADYIPNYDGKWKEPLVLPSTIPNLLINRTSGMAVAATTSIPGHQPERVFTMLNQYIEGERDLKKLVKTLGDPYYLFGGHLLSDRKDLLNMYKVGHGTLNFSADYVVDEGKTNDLVRIIGFPPGFTKIDKFCDKLLQLPWVSAVDDQSGISNPINLIVAVKRGHSFRENEQKFQQVLKQHQTFNWNVTITSAIEGESQFKHVDLLSYLEMWVDYRTKLEHRWIDYNVGQQEREIFRLDTVLLSSLNIDKVMKALKQRDSKEALMKLLKINDEQAEIILSMQVRSLASKNQDDLRSKIKKCKEVIKDWGKKKKNMTSHLATTFETYAGKLTNAVIGLKAQSNDKGKKKKSKKRK